LGKIFWIFENSSFFFVVSPRGGSLKAPGGALSDTEGGLSEAALSEAGLSEGARKALGGR